MRIHFVGIGGIGISALAQYCVAKGDKVTGSDISESEIFPKLNEAGIVIQIPQKEENVPKHADLVVYSEAVPEDNPERVFARKNGIREYSYFRFLGEILKGFRTIAVAGTHGKTTTCGMIASGCLEASFEATFFVGSTLKEFDNSNFFKGSSNWAIIEACEYRENFRFLDPEIIVLTNVEWDHPDSYPTESSYFNAFKKFISKAKVVLYHAEDKNAEKVLEGFKGELIAVPHQSPNSWEFLLSVYGKHNHENATLALILAQKLNLNIELFKKGLEKFKGAGRRQEYLGKKNGINIYDDYGHHPTEIRATIDALRQKHPKAKIGLIFEPHQFSRTYHFFDSFVSALQQADVSGIYPIYEARDKEEDKAAVSTEKLAKAVGTEVIRTTKDIERRFYSKLKEGDVLLFMGAGEISLFSHEFSKI